MAADSVRVGRRDPAAAAKKWALKPLESKPRTKRPDNCQRGRSGARWGWL